MLERIKLLIAANKTLLDNLFTGLLIHAEKAMKKVLNSPSITTALLAYIGYNTATRLALEMKESGSDIYQANEKLGLIEEAALKNLLEPSKLLKEGYTLSDMINTTPEIPEN